MSLPAMNQALTTMLQSPFPLWCLLKELKLFSKDAQQTNQVQTISLKSLTLQLTFRVASPDGDEYFPATTFTASREITYNEEDYNSRDAEEALLYNEMQEELIIQLLNRLSTIKPHIHAY